MYELDLYKVYDLGLYLGDLRSPMLIKDINLDDPSSRWAKIHEWPAVVVFFFGFVKVLDLL